MGSIGNPAQPAGEHKWPVKTREINNHHLNSQAWNDFKFRPDDIVISTWAKSGTTWTQQIVTQLIFNGDPDAYPTDKSPWLDLRVIPTEATYPMLEAQEHRRYIKTHLPIDALRYDQQAKYIFVARDARDVIWSMHNHFHCATPAFYSMINDTPGRQGPAMERPPADPRDHFLQFLEDDSNPARTHSPFWAHTRGWWEARNLPNLLLVHFADLKADPEAEIRRIAKFLDIQVPEDKWPAILEHSSFAYMKKNADKIVPPMAEAMWENGGQTFMHKGVNGRWKDSLTEEESKQYEALALKELGPEAAEWLAHGRKNVNLHD